MPAAGSASPATRPRTDPQSALVLQPRFGPFCSAGGTGHDGRERSRRVGAGPRRAGGRGSGRGSGGSSRAGARWRTCAGCSRPWSARTAGSWPRRRATATPDGMQDFLGRMRWDADAVRDDLRAYVVEHLGDPGAVLVLDETGFVKKGDEVGGRAAAVQRHRGPRRELPGRRLPRLRRAGTGQALIDRALYLPEGWAGDAGRRAGAGVPARGRLRHQAEARRGDAGAGAGRRRAVRVGDRRQRLRRRPRPAAADRGARRARLRAGGHQRPAAGRQARGRVGGRGPAGGLAAAERRRGQPRGRGSTTGPTRPTAAAPRPAGRRGCWSGASSTSRTSWPST